jgi:hypothetical protein
MAARLKVLTYIAETAEEVVVGHRSMEALAKAVQDWKAGGGS